MKLYEKFKGMVAATFTPMNEDGSVNYGMIQTYADYIVSSGIKAIFVNGTTGESLSLTVLERKQILESWIKASAGRIKVIAHVGCNSQMDAIQLAAHAQEVGADAIGAMAPSFFKPATVMDLVDFFVPVAAAASELPFYYYNMPSITGVNLPVDQILVEGKKKMPNLVGTKFTHNNLMELSKCLNLNDCSFEVLNGFDEILIAGLAFGVKAGVGSTYNYIPQIYAGIFNAMEANDLVKARELQSKSIEVVDIIIKYGGGIRGGKAIMKFMGVDCGSCRLPFHPFSDEEYAQLENDLKKVGVLM